MLAGLLAAACDRPDPFVQAEAAYARADYAAARALYEKALAGDASEVPEARVRARLGLTLRKLGDLEAAEQALRAAIAEARSGGDPATEAVARRYLGQVHAARGEREAAMAQYEAALAWHRAHGPEADLLKVQLGRAALAWEMDDFQAAYDAYSDVHDRARPAGEPGLEAAALDGLGMLMGHVGEHEAARWLVERAAERHAAAGRVEAHARSLLNQANLAVELGRPDEGRRLAERARAVAERSGNARLRARVELVVANAWLAESLFERALAAADAALAIAEPAGLDTEVDNAWILRAMALAERGRWDAVDAALQAIERRGGLPERWRGYLEDVAARRAAAAGDAEGELGHLRRAVDHFERLRGTLATEHRAGFFSRKRLAVYQGLLRALVRRGRVDEAARLVGRLKARTLVEVLRESHRGGPARPALDPRRLQRGANLLRLAADAGAAGIDRRRLPPGLAVLDYYALPEELVVFWATREAHELFRVPVPAADLAAQAAALEKGILGRGRGFEAPAAWLAARLLDPVAERLNGPGAPRRLGIVPHGPLHRVPFEVLPWAGGRLVDRFEVFEAPGLPALVALLDDDRALVPGRSSVLAVGDAVENLPGARVEAGRVARFFPRRVVLLGEKALETRVRSAVGAADVVHFAVHGIEPAPGRPGYLELLPDSRNDGRLYADEIATLQLRASLVVLSACDSGVGLPDRGDERRAVIDRAFLRAGARTVVSSRWPVSDAATLLFMEAFYGGLAEKGRLGAFAAAQRALRQGRLSVDDLDGAVLAAAGTGQRGVRRPAPEQHPPDFTHPFFWASFALEGDPR